MKKYIIAAILLIAIVTMALYVFDAEDAHIKNGIYEYGKIEDGKWSTIDFEEGKFYLSLNFTLSHVPNGSFEINGDKLILNGTGDDETFILKILNENELKLTDFPSKYDKFLKKGAVYRYYTG